MDEDKLAKVVKMLEDLEDKKSTNSLKTFSERVCPPDHEEESRENLSEWVDAGRPREWRLAESAGSIDVFTDSGHGWTIVTENGRIVEETKSSLFKVLGGRFVISTDYLSIERNQVIYQRYNAENEYNHGTPEEWENNGY